MGVIRDSVFSIYRIGPGPSSSHTIAPMRAAGDFLARLRALNSTPHHPRLEAHCYGSLAATGPGHGSDRAIAAGLLGQVPETCDTALLSNLFARPDESLDIHFGHGALAFTRRQVVYHQGDNPFPYANALAFRLVDADGNAVLEETYFSPGGGEIIRAGAPAEGATRLAPPHRYRDWDSFRTMVEQSGLRPEDAVAQNEASLAGADTADSDVAARESARRIELMCEGVERGLAAEGLLPGPLKVSRRAAAARAAAVRADDPAERAFLSLDAYALAAAEENAAGSLVVTAPTSGASGVVPAAVYYLRKDRGVGDDDLRRGLLLAGVVGLVAKRNAGISGAEMGCQGEVGVAAAMAAALWAGAAGAALEVVETAAEIALEHHLGLICDPVDGYVQIPCIERNAVAAVTAANAYLLARTRAGRGRVRFDEAVAAMREAGRKMCPEFRETARGGLAVCALCQ